MQETFAAVLARPRMIRGDERGYLMQALRNTFYTRLRTASRRPRTGTPLDDLQPPDARTSGQPEAAAEMGEILEAIAELPEDFRLAIVAIDIVGLSYGEAARALGTREGTITTRVYRARQRIAHRFSDPPPPASDAPGARDARDARGARDARDARDAREGSGPKRSLA